MTQKNRQRLLGLLGLLIIALLLSGAVWLIFVIWHRFVALNPNLAVGFVTAAATVFAATSAITLGRYLERKKEIEAHYREKKTVIYDSFLKEFFKVFHSDTPENVDIVPFLREWQRQMILWGGAEVIASFIRWKANLGNANAQSMFKTEEFFRALRKDLGLSNRGLERGAFIRLILRHSELFFVMAAENPSVTLDEIAKREKELGLSE